MSFAESRGRLMDAVFARFGEDAIWADQAEPVRVIPREEDTDARFADATQIVAAKFLRVRKSEVASPEREQLVALVNGPTFKLIADPELDRRGVWRCQVSEQP